MATKRSEINIFKIAEEAGVSISSVSRVMNNRTGVSDETRIKIHALLKKYGFTSVYQRQRAPKIAFLTPWEDLTEYFRRALKGVCRFCHEHHMELSIIVRSGNERNSLLQQIRDQQCSGVIASLPEQLDYEHLEVIKTEIPVVFLDTPMSIANTGFIDNDSYSGSCEATRHLIELGHRKIGYLRYHGGSINQLQRVRGYEDTMKAAGLLISDGWVVSTPPSPKPEVARGACGIIAMRQLLAQAPEVTAVMAVDDDMAMGAMSVIHRSGLRIPADISVVGFDNDLDTPNWFCPLTTVDHPVEEEGYRAAKALDYALKHPRDWKLPRVILPTKLVVRDSTGPVPQRD
jgi:LacI family transcriptional regulator